MKTASHITIPTRSFRQLETPFQKQGYRDYFAVVAIKDLPDLSSWRKINVRDSKLTGSVPDRIREGLRDPELFLFMNRGITLSAESVSFDNKTGNLTLTMSDKNLHGLLDGGHTYMILLEERESYQGSQYVKLEILQGFDSVEAIEKLVDARNTSNQVRDESLMNLVGRFDPLKKAIKGSRYADLIAFSEYELQEDGTPKPIDIREVIAILTTLDKDHYGDQVHPINAYRSKAACLEHFKSHESSYKKIYPIAKTVLELYDHIQQELPDLYNKARGMRGEVSGGKFGHLTGVTTYRGSRKAQLLFIGQESNYGVPAGFVYPILGAFRALLREKNGEYSWAKKLDPLELLRGELGRTLADTIGNFALDAKNPSKTGKSLLVWQACYQSAQVVFLKSIT